MSAATMVCPACTRRYAGIVEPDCGACRGSGVLLVDGTRLREPDPRVTARSVEMHIRAAEAGGDDQVARDVRIEEATDDLVGSGLVQRSRRAVAAVGEDDPNAELRTAQPTEHPCELHTYHAPKVMRTQGHHVYPIYLQRRLWGQIRRPDIMWVCGLCHDSIHTQLSAVLGEARPSTVTAGHLVRRNVELVTTWYERELALQAAGSSTAS